jgi:streptogramin lyase
MLLIHTGDKTASRRTALMTCLLATLVALSWTGSGRAADEPSPPAKPDLDVTYIAQRPLYPGYWMDYPNDVPTFWVPDPNAADGKHEVTREEFMRLTKYQPAAGDKITFTAHVRNNGFAPAPATRYRLYLDEAVVAEGELLALAPDAEATCVYEWKYQDGRHTIACVVDPDNRVDEISKLNNRLTDPTWGIGLTIRAWDPANYKGFRSTPNLWGTYSFEDWCQAHIQEWRKAFREAIYPATPQGILQGIRFDGIYTSLEDPALVELRQALRAMTTGAGRSIETMPEASREWMEKESCSWRIDWKIDDIPNYAKKIDGGLIHELCHQCGIIDLYQLGMGLKSNLVTDPNGHFLWVAEGCFHQFCDLMAVYGENTEDALTQHGLFREHTAAAFNSEIGKPRWGFGLYLFDLPQHNVLRFLDNRGQPIPDAEVKLYQQEIETRVVGAIPPKVGRTDAAGEWDLGPRPIDKIHVVGTNGITVIGIQAYGQWEYHTLVITEMNIAYWRGDRDRHVYVLHTGIAPPGSAPAPTNVRIADGLVEGFHRVEGRPNAVARARLSWDYPADERRVQKFAVLKRSAHVGSEYAPSFEKSAVEVCAQERSADVEVEARPRDLFTIVAVDEMGNRSGYSNIAVYPPDEVLPEVDRVFGIAVTPDGSIYTLNSDVATLFGLGPRGARLSLAGKVQFDAPEVVACVASDSAGLLYVPNPKAGFVYRVDPVRQQRLEDLRCAAFKAPRGIAIDREDRLYVSDLAARQVHVLGKDGKVLGAIGGPDVLAAPQWVYVDKQGLVYVADCLLEKDNFRKTPGSIQVFRRKPGGAWDFERTLLIDKLAWTECVIADEQGRIYVGGAGGIFAFDAQGQRLAQWQQKPYGTPGGAEIVSGLAWDRNGDLLVTQGFTLRQLLRLRLDEILSAH